MFLTNAYFFPRFWIWCKIKLRIAHVSSSHGHIRLILKISILYLWIIADTKLEVNTSMAACIVCRPRRWHGETERCWISTHEFSTNPFPSFVCSHLGACARTHPKRCNATAYLFSNFKGRNPVLLDLRIPFSCP